MNIIYFLLPAALLMVLIFVGLFLWAAKHDQFEDMETPARRILLDDSAPSDKTPQSPPRA
jgi:cbb3-type cytochrome oxidase maturation protein